MSVDLSILDLAQVGSGETVGESFAASVDMAQRAEAWGYRRIWYAEHHNMSSIASAAPAVLIAHIAAHTETIRLGAGGVMLPNHSPLAIAEQFGTLAELHPGRIDLGLGRAPGGDQQTFAALRRSMASADRFPSDVLELQAYLRGRSRVEGVNATPGAGTDIPLYILGSSLFGAQLAAALGLPYAFASHFAPQALEEAVALYRREFQPSEQLDAPYVIAGVCVIADEDEAVAAEQLRKAKRARVNALFARDRRFSDEEADMVLDMPQGRQIEAMMTYSGVGTPAQVTDYLDWFTGHAHADELIVASIAPDRDVWLNTLAHIAPARALSAAGD
ncbi:LLM class flavin-dependent oxidoreductase [Gordonia sp. Z-3]|jgi:luciferase family oxidoreductase group 1|uniref:LLM class flavin-dependent oxidoreductase n=2 Tax=Gordonia TaxID=2053 RepID=A0A9X3I5P4_9ACTN|nr:MULTISPECIES: LLM class flavin-dependent oxidoreductase [Gordonia]MAU84144.1 alkane 1-monooxygenase [Gordonia sp. (in: high G+C Gram-positive bacteria)]MCF3937853.1 LLM class flavin-dependent oxidoreductase [Gordonia tangerina]MCX2964709.1 LLM class flavin-dependent oxidoreductase [Gordonia aquimaris]MED5800821.1 LLM class flavin-dependent oxidoreductase [Gordonia sp. Z-3]